MSTLRDVFARGPLEVLQQQRLVPADGRMPTDADRTAAEAVAVAAAAIAYYVPPTTLEQHAHRSLSRALMTFLVEIVRNTPPGPERSTAIARAREAKLWASAAVALQRAQPAPATTDEGGTI